MINFVNSSMNKDEIAWIQLVITQLKTISDRLFVRSSSIFTTFSKNHKSSVFGPLKFWFEVSLPVDLNFLKLLKTKK